MWPHKQKSSGSSAGEANKGSSRPEDLHNEPHYGAGRDLKYKEVVVVLFKSIECL